MQGLSHRRRQWYVPLLAALRRGEHCLTSDELHLSDDPQDAALEVECVLSESHDLTLSKPAPRAHIHHGPVPLGECRYEIDHMREALFARVPTADEVQMLQLPAGEPVVELHRTTYTADGTIVEFAVGVHSASRIAWEYDCKVPDSAQDRKGQE